MIYGNIYFRAWKSLEGASLLKLEYNCIQDLMYLCIHASIEKTHKNLKIILHVIHEQKKYKGIDEMLYRCYEPIIWRALKVANPIGN
jgi:condensin-2 complex subunit G2